SCLLCSSFYSHGHHRNLPSFPTRRSSDLEPGPQARPFARLPPATSGGHQPRLAAAVRAAAVRAAGARGRLRQGGAGGLRWWLGRSEEHTSELQSRRPVGCRLLLEKKKARK